MSHVGLDCLAYQPSRSTAEQGNVEGGTDKDKDRVRRKIGWALMNRVIQDDAYFIPISRYITYMWFLRKRLNSQKRLLDAWSLTPKLHGPRALDHG